MSATAYTAAAAFITKQSGSGAEALAKLILSLYSRDHRYPICDCLAPLDPKRSALAIDMCAHYAERGECAELVAAAGVARREYPHLAAID